MAPSQHITACYLTAFYKAVAIAMYMPVSCLLQREGWLNLFDHYRCQNAKMLLWASEDHDKD